MIVSESGDGNINPIDIIIDIGLIEYMIYFNMNINGNIVIFLNPEPAE